MATGRRVVITGLGTVSSLGVDLDRFWSGLCTPDPVAIHTPVRDFDAAGWFSAKQLKRSDPFARYGVVAAHLAVTDAGYDATAVDARRAGVVMSTAYGALESIDEERAGQAEHGDGAVSPFLAVVACENVVASMISTHFGWRGPSRLIVTACAGGTHAVSEAAELVRSGRCDVVVAGGTQGRITPLLLTSFRNLRVLSSSGRIRPFDRRRDGFVFAEGAAALTLEPLDSARARGARIYAEVLGSGHTNDAESLVSPSGRGAVECIEDALADAGLDPRDIVHVNAHGTGTTVNDRQEAAALHTVFAIPPPVTSIKRVLGHAAGASGAFEAAAAALTVHHGLMPSLGTDVEPDTELDLDLVVGAPRPVDPGPVLSNSFGLGGANGCLILGPVR